MSIEDIFSKLRTSAKIKNYEDRIKALKKNKANNEYKIIRLVDLTLEGTLDDALNSKNERINHEIEQYQVANGEDEKNWKGIEKIKDDMNILEQFYEI